MNDAADRLAWRIADCIHYDLDIAEVQGIAARLRPFTEAARVVVLRLTDLPEGAKLTATDVAALSAMESAMRAAVKP